MGCWASIRFLEHILSSRGLQLPTAAEPTRLASIDGMLSCSTCWNSGRHTDGEAMLQEIVDLGFTRVELGHGVRISLMEGVLKGLERGLCTISSLHNFCPLPVEITRASPD